MHYAEPTLNEMFLNSTAIFHEAHNPQTYGYEFPLNNAGRARFVGEWVGDKFLIVKWELFVVPPANPFEDWAKIPVP